MKITLAQLDFQNGFFERNTEKIILAIREAEALEADLVVFPELAIGGTPANDFLEYDSFGEQCSQSLKQIADACEKTACIIGIPSPVEADNKRFFNSAAFCHAGEVRFFHKHQLKNTDLFDESRHFDCSDESSALHFKGIKFFVLIGEGLVDHIALDEEFLLREIEKHQPQFILNIAASPFHASRAAERQESLQKIALKTGLPFIFLNQTGAQTDILFDGGSLVFDDKGQLAHRLPFFAEAIETIDLSILRQGFVMTNDALPDEIVLIHNALVMGIRDYFVKQGFSRALLGLSGGLDSAVTMALAVSALGAQNVTGLLMPSAYSTPHSITDALDLARNLGTPTETIEIAPLFDAFINELQPVFRNKPADVTEENIQARIRGVLLMAVSNKFGSILLNTSNKSEIAVGYGTLYGDMNGGLAVLGDVYKTQVYALAHYINREKEIIPLHTITKPPSAELRPDQKDSDSLPDYNILDQILFHHIELQKGAAEIIREGFDATTVAKVLRLVSLNEYKRKQAAPVLRVSSKAFGAGRRMPIGSKFIP